MLDVPQGGPGRRLPARRTPLFEAPGRKTRRLGQPAAERAHDSILASADNDACSRDRLRHSTT